MTKDDLVTIEHPDQPGSTVTCERKQFDMVWSKRGWREATLPDPAALTDGKEQHDA